MTEQDQDRVELEAAHEALRTARTATTGTDAALAAIHRSSEEIRSIVERNGYVDRFRAMLRGA